MTTSERAGPFIGGFLLLSILVGACVVLLAPPHTRAPFLVLALLATFALVVVTAFVIRQTAGLPSGQIHPLQRSSAWQVLSRSQWLALTLGVTLIAALTGVGTGFRMVVDMTTPEKTAATTPPLPEPPPTTTPAYSPPPSPESTPSQSPSDAPSGSASGSDLPTDGPSVGPGRISYLDNLEAVNGYYRAGPINLSGKRYPRSVNFSCEKPTNSFVEWSVAGSREFAATLGIADETSNAFGRIVEMIFYDQDGRQLGKPIDVSVGHPVPITLPLTGVVHMRMACSARDAKDGSVRSVNAAMGDALIVSG